MDDKRENAEALSVASEEYYRINNHYINQWEPLLKIYEVFSFLTIGAENKLGYLSSTKSCIFYCYKSRKYYFYKKLRFFLI